MYINREISWLEFNQRVLQQAQRQELPLLERIKFLSITASNLDEFFQVRVGGLLTRQENGQAGYDPAGLSPSRQLELIRQRCIHMVAEQYGLFRHELLPLMKQAGIAPQAFDTLPESVRSSLEESFNANVAPLLSPLAMEIPEPPVLPSLNIILGLEVENPAKGEKRFVAVCLPEALPRRIHYSSHGHEGYVLAEDLVAHCIGSLFPAEIIRRRAVFRVTRNGDIAVAEEEGGNFAHEMEEVLVARKFSQCVRLELPADCEKDFARRISEIVGANEEGIYRIHGPLRLVDFGEMAFEPGHDKLKVKAWEPCWPAAVDPSQSMFDNIAEGDILIHNPFESYEPVVRLIEEAAEDRDVVAIKQVLYRIAPDSRFVRALCRAAEAGKQVTVLIELKARFDEGHNLMQAERLQRAGVQVLYGVKGFKTHAKISLIVRRENGILRRYCHFGTGNYNEKTARIYSDISLLSCDENLGADASQFFNSVTGLTRLMNFRRIYPSPAMMKARLLELISAESRRARMGEHAEIRAKMNSLNDTEIIDALEEAADAGVKISLNIRGICCWAPSSERARAGTRIISIVDRYLEHARILCFHNGGSPLVYIASADWMRRNLDRRVELMVPVEDAELAKRLRGILDSCFADNSQAYLLQADGSSIPVPAQGRKPLSMQASLQRQAEQSARNLEQAKRQTLVPHRAK